jgi:hypothetical protein
MNQRALIRLICYSLSLSLLAAGALNRSNPAAQSRDNYCGGSTGWPTRNVKVSVTTVYSDSLKSQAAAPVYKHGEPITATVWMTNLADQPTCVCVSVPSYQNQPRLRRDGQEVPYLLERAEFINKYWDSQEPCMLVHRSFELVKLEPRQPRRVDWFVLNEGKQKSANIKWYDTLEPGHYQLSLLRKLDCCAGPDVQAESFSFEIVDDEFIAKAFQ